MVQHLLKLTLMRIPALAPMLSHSKLLVISMKLSNMLLPVETLEKFLMWIPWQELFMSTRLWIMKHMTGKFDFQYLFKNLKRMSTYFFLNFSVILLIGVYTLLKPSQIRRAKKFSSCTKYGVFVHSWQLRKRHQFWCSKKLFGPSYVETALV